MEDWFEPSITMIMMDRGNEGSTAMSKKETGFQGWRWIERREDGINIDRRRNGRQVHSNMFSVKSTITCNLVEFN